MMDFRGGIHCPHCTETPRTMDKLSAHLRFTCTGLGRDRPDPSLDQIVKGL